MREVYIGAELRRSEIKSRPRRIQTRIRTIILRE